MFELNDNAQQEEISRLSLQLRSAYYESNRESIGVYPTPYGGRMTESIGAWPEFILKGTFCKRSIQGLCSPCFYSRFPLTKANRHDYLAMLKSQTSYVTNNFDELVVKRQYGLADDSFLTISLVLTPTGSFFDEYEFPIAIRLEMEKALVNFAQVQNTSINLHIETHADDLIEYDYENANGKTEISYLKVLNTKIIFGLESADEYVRNVLYNKKLTLHDFETAIKKAQLMGLATGAFVFAGLFALNDLQTHDDVVSSVKYLLEQSIFPVIMFQNAQPYTITDVLLKKAKITMLEPFTVAWIVEDVLELVEQSASYYLIADPIGGPPDPDMHIFKEARLTCDNCSESIYKELVNLRKSRDVRAFSISMKKIRQCRCYNNYRKYIDGLSLDMSLLRNRADYLLRECRSNIAWYLELTEEQR
ncbi:MAG: hypothetical protein FWD38_06190 [Oscillospiraceae bacterium]|nr:hypothetical protein [Oscillospiraceae bacterium]